MTVRPISTETRLDRVRSRRWRRRSRRLLVTAELAGLMLLLAPRFLLIAVAVAIALVVIGLPGRWVDARRNRRLHERREAARRAHTTA